MKAWCTVLLGSIWLVLGATAVQAGVPLASPEEDQYSKLAIPPYGKGLLYIYRQADGRKGVAPAILLNQRDAGKLDPNTFGWWSVSAGNVEIRGGDAKGTPLVIQSKQGESVFVQMVVGADGRVTLSQVPRDKGLKDIQSARLILRSSAVTAKTSVPVEEPEPEESKPSTKRDEYGVTLTFKAGMFVPSDRSQTIDNASRKLDGSSVIYGLQGEWRHDELGLAVGLELFTHTHGYKSTASTETGDVQLSYAILNFKYYFNTGTLIQPYVGAGLGRTVASFSGGINGDVDSNAWQGVFGVNLRWNYVDFYSEYKYLHDEFILGGKATGTGSALLVGVSAHF